MVILHKSVIPICGLPCMHPKGGSFLWKYIIVHNSENLYVRFAPDLATK